MSYSLLALREYRERRKREASGTLPPKPLLNEVSPDAPMGDGIVLGCWNGEQFVSWETWRATKPVEVDERETSEADAGTAAVSAVCGGTRVWLVRDSERWLMFAGSRRPASRRRDFASPSLDHAKRTAELWYGLADCDWKSELKKEKEETTKQ